MDSADLFDPELGAQTRSGAELSALLVELARVLKARGFYAPGHPKLTMLFEQGVMSWRGDLERHGDLEFEVTPGGFRSAGAHEVLKPPQLAGLHEAFRVRAVSRVRVEAWIDAEAFAGLVETLRLDADLLAGERGALRALYARVPAGIVFNDTPPERMAPASSHGEEDDPLHFAGGARPKGADAPQPAPPAQGTSGAEEADEPTASTRPGTSPADAAAHGEAHFPPDSALEEASLGDDFEIDRGWNEAWLPDAPEDEEPERELFEAALRSEEAPQASEEEDPGWVFEDDATDPDTPATDPERDAERAAPELMDETALAPASPSGEGGEALRFADEPETDEPRLPAPEEDLDARDDLFGPAGADGSGLELRFEEADDAESARGEAPEADLAELPDSPPSGRRPSFDELEEGPLERGVVDLQSAELVDLLRELHDCDDTSQYPELARRACQMGERAAENGRPEDAYRVMLVLAHHAAERGKRAERQCDMAQEFLVSLARGEQLEHLIDRACAKGPESSVRATQVLLQLGEEVVPTLLGAAVLEKDADRRGQMHGVLIAMGEKTLGALLQAMEADDPLLVRTAVRLAGESQHPGAVAKLAELLRQHADRETREEAAKALVRVGTSQALDRLVRALDDPRVGELAVYCLGASASARAVAPLVDAMHAAIDAGRLDRAREVIRALGRLGRAEAVPALAALLLRKSMLGRRKLRELKLAAATALGGLPGDEAVGALAQVARARDPQLRRVAQTALDRRARSLSTRAASG